VKPIEVLVSLRDVRSELYFEQMKGRGARTLPSEKLREVTPDADAKTRFVLIDAVGVTESLKTVGQPLERDRAVSFDRLLDEIAAGRRDDDAFATLAARLAALDRRVGDGDRAAIVKAAGGLDLAGLATRLLDAIDPDVLAARVAKDASEPGQRAARETAKDEAVALLDDPAFAPPAEGSQGQRRHPHRHDLDRCCRLLGMGRTEGCRHRRALSALPRGAP
jgi:type I restriction enzyme R subunit